MTQKSLNRRRAQKSSLKGSAADTSWLPRLTSLLRPRVAEAPNFAVAGVPSPQGAAASVFQRIAENATDMIIRYSQHGEILFVSPASMAVLGCPPQALIGRRMSDFLHPDDIVSVGAHNLSLRIHPIDEGAEAETIVFRLQRADGGWAWVEGRPRIVFDVETGATREIQDALRDISHRKALEIAAEAERAREAAEAAARTERLADLTVDLETSLGGVLTSSALLAEHDQLNQTDLSAVRRVAAAGETLFEIAHEILDARRAEDEDVAASTETVHVRGLLEEAVAFMSAHARQRDLDLSLHLESSLPESGVVDRGRVRQTLLKLIGNALRTTEEGAVRVTARYDDHLHRLRCEILDTGCGYTEDEVREIVGDGSGEHPSAKRRGGYDPGVAFAKSMVAAMGGEMGVVSLEGLGACFWFEIPCPLATVEKVSLAGEKAVALSGARVLAIDASAANRDLFRLMLTETGVEVTVARPGEEALALASSMPFDLLLVGFGGGDLETAGTVRNLTRASGPNDDVPILAVCSAADKRLLETLVGDDVFYGWVSKPVAPQALTEAIAAVCVPPPPFALIAAA